ncbi:MAG: PaaI family thioesterase [Raoultibacter sp.]|jgi:1,4-dihydroxy-2-naphthoyl-CoA hydrolase
MLLEDSWIEKGYIEFVERSTERVEMIYTVQEEHLTPLRALNGGINGVLIETAASIGATLVVEEGYHAVGVTLNVNHVRSASLGERLRVISLPVKSGKSMHFWSGEIINEQGKTTCFGDLTMMKVKSEI